MSSEPPPKTQRTDGSSSWPQRIYHADSVRVDDSESLLFLRVEPGATMTAVEACVRMLVRSDLAEVYDLGVVVDESDAVDADGFVHAGTAPASLRHDAVIPWSQGGDNVRLTVYHEPDTDHGHTFNRGDRLAAYLRDHTTAGTLGKLEIRGDVLNEDFAVHFSPFSSSG